MRLPSHFLPYQSHWVLDRSRLKLIEKSRQIGLTYADAYHSVLCAGHRFEGLDVWVSTRDEFQAKLYLEDCKHWARFLHIAAKDLGQVILDSKTRASALALQFANGKRIYALSSNPNALAGKRGHVKLDEFALHPDQRLLYYVAPGVIQWGGTLSIISTHRGAHTLFNQLIQDIKFRGNPKGWSFHSVNIEQAVEAGLVERINQTTKSKETREEFLARIRSQCISDEQWDQEYCCRPADESSAFISYDMIEACEDHCLNVLTHECPNEDLFRALSLTIPDLSSHGSLNPDLAHRSARPVFYLGVDVARKHDLCVMDLGEKIGDVIWDRVRIELRNASFQEIKYHLNRLLSRSGLQRACLDASGLGMQLAEEARKEYGWRVEPITFTQPLKEEMAYKLRHAFEDRKLRIPIDDNLRSDLRGIKKEVTSSGNIRFAGEAPDSHCDRFWAKALRQHAATSQQTWCPIIAPSGRRAEVLADRRDRSLPG
ncbi:MAG: hypothetical protein C5B50_21285 [Verrucomicrobia bacterium]|nr:MAG: hypothetical protein C5B50_21285 [Verrucomicrobiota bacterium]